MRGNGIPIRGAQSCFYRQDWSLSINCPLGCKYVRIHGWRVLSVWWKSACKFGMGLHSKSCVHSKQLYNLAVDFSWLVYLSWGKYLVIDILYANDCDARGTETQTIIARTMNVLWISIKNQGDVRIRGLYALNKYFELVWFDASRAISLFKGSSDNFTLLVDKIKALD